MPGLPNGFDLGAAAREAMMAEGFTPDLPPEAAAEVRAAAARVTAARPPADTAACLAERSAPPDLAR